MNHLIKRTKNYKALYFPLVAGMIAGWGSLVYLLAIPADPKNALVGGLSAARIIEALGILIGLLLLTLVFWRILKNPGFYNQIYEFLSWNSPSGWSLAICWIVLCLSVFMIISASQIFPAFKMILERLLPVFIFSGFFSLAFVLANLMSIDLRLFVEKSVFLGKITIFLFFAGIFGGLIIMPAKIGLALREGSILLLVGISTSLYISLRSFRIVNQLSAIVFFVILCGGSLIGVWASGISDLNIVAGLLPYNDANGYYHGARSLSEGLLFLPFSGKRPIFPAILGTLYTLGGSSLQFAIGGLIVLAIFAFFLSSVEIRKSLGAFCATFFSISLFLFFRRFIGSTMSETIGLPLGIIGFGLLWSSAYRHKLAEAIGGLFMLTFGLIARAGPLLMVPMVILWIGWHFRENQKFNWRAALLSTLGAVLSYVVHIIIFKLLSGPDSSSMSNFSYTLYGLVVGGKGWKQYILDHPDLLSLVEPALSQAIYRYTLEAFISDPQGILHGAFTYWRAFFNFEWYGAFGYIVGISNFETYFFRILMGLLSVLGLNHCIRNLKNPAYSMILCGVIGIILSVPFVPTLDAEIRTYAASIPWFVGLATIGLWSVIRHRQEKISDPLEEKNKSGSAWGLWTFSGITVLLGLVLPLTIHAITEPVKIPEKSHCSFESVRIITNISRGSYINVLADSELRQSMIPNLRYTDFNWSMHNSPMYSLAKKMVPINAGYSFFNGYNRLENRFDYIIGPTDLFEENQGIVELCGFRDTGSDDYGFFHAESAFVLRSE